LLGQPAREFGAPREQRDGHPLARERARQRGAVPFPHPDHGTYRLAHDASILHSARSSASSRVNGTNATGSTSRSVICPAASFSSTRSDCAEPGAPTGITSRPPGRSEELTAELQ